MLAVIGDQFAHCDAEPSADKAEGEHGASDWPQICGCTISVRQNEDIITVWNRVESDPRVKDKIKYVRERPFQETCLIYTHTAKQYEEC